jgi:hypothetical protein
MAKNPRSRRDKGIEYEVSHLPFITTNFPLVILNSY